MLHFPSFLLKMILRTWLLAKTEKKKQLRNIPKLTCVQDHKFESEFDCSSSIMRQHYFCMTDPSLRMHVIFFTCYFIAYDIVTGVHTYLYSVGLTVIEKALKGLNFAPGHVCFCSAIADSIHDLCFIQLSVIYVCTWPSTGQCMAVRPTLTLFYYYHHHHLLQSAVQVILCAWIWFCSWFGFLHAPLLQLCLFVLH